MRKQDGWQQVSLSFWRSGFAFEQKNTLYEMLDAKEITNSELQEDMKKAGGSFILSNKEMSEKEHTSSTSEGGRREEIWYL